MENKKTDKDVIATVNSVVERVLKGALIRGENRAINQIERTDKRFEENKPMIDKYTDVLNIPIGDFVTKHPIGSAKEHRMKMVVNNFMEDFKQSE